MSDSETGQLERPLTHAERGKLGGRPNKYDAEQIERALQLMALYLGDSGRTSQELDIPESTLRAWRSKQHAERYEQIRNELMPGIHAQMAQETEDLAIGYAAIERDLMRKMSEQVNDLTNGKDTANALKALTTSRAISVDKALLLRDKPTQIVKHDVSEDIKALIAAGVLETDSTAEEIQDADVVG